MNKAQHLSIVQAGWRSQLVAAYALMAIIPLLCFGYLLLTYVEPALLTRERLIIFVLFNVVISFAGFMILFRTGRSLHRLRDHLAAIAGGDLSSEVTVANGPDTDIITDSIRRIVERMQMDNERLEAVTRNLEQKFIERTRELGSTNRLLERELAERRKVEQTLRDTNMKLSDAFMHLKEIQQRVIQQERLNALTQMSSGIAHELNNTLMPIMGFTELILSDDAILDNRDDFLAIVKDMNVAAQQASQVVKNLRQFYREPEKTSLTDLSLGEVMHEALRLCTPKLRAATLPAGMEIVIQESIDNSILCRIDATTIRETLLNLILNAVDAMPQGGELKVTVRRDATMAIAEVSDTGVGMSQEVLRHCMDPFFTTKGSAGTGMGLTISDNCIRHHGGMLKITSEPGRGTTATISLPLIEKPTTCATPATDDVVIPVVPMRLRVLLVDDDILCVESLRRTLHREGHEIFSANSGREGLRIFGEDTFDLVITDRAMPDMSGDEVATALRKKDPDIPIIMLTGFGTIMNDHMEKPDGVNLVLGKPVTGKELLLAIQEITTLPRFALRQ